MGWGSFGGGKNQSSSSQESRPTTPQELEAYFNSMSNLSGGQLADWAMTGTPETYYNGLTPQQMQAIGGAGETRQLGVDEALADQQEKIQRSGSATYAQSSRSNQNAVDAAMAQKDTVNKEVEAALTGLASQEAMRQYQADLANAGLTAQDMALLSQIYYGGKGQYSKGTNDSSSWNFKAAGGFASG